MASEERRNQLESWLAEGQRESDKILVTVSSGLIAVSLPFLKQLDELTSKHLLIITWLLLLSTIGLVLVSLVFEKLEISARIKKIYIDQWEGGWSWRNRILSVTNVFAGVSFLSGLVCMVSFLMANVN